MTLAASNNVTQLLTQLLEEGTIRTEHRRILLEKHRELRTALLEKYHGKIWHAAPQERHAILCGQLAVSLRNELHYDLTPEVLSQAIYRQQRLRIACARKDIVAAVDGDSPQFEFWVANLHQSMYDQRTHDHRLVSVGDLAREMAVLATHNPKIRAIAVEHLDALREVLENIHFHEDEARISRQLHAILDNILNLAESGNIRVLEVYDQQGGKKRMTKDDLIQFLNDTRYMVTG